MRKVLAAVCASAVLGACGGPAPAPRRTEGRRFEVPAGKSCSPVHTVKESDRAHVSPPERVSYETSPPTSGKHYGDRPVAPGVYGEPVQDEILVHNMEHGHVLVQYDGLTEQELARVREAVFADPFMLVMLPRPGLYVKLALTAWEKAQVCARIPKDVVEVILKFVKENRDKAPESIAG